MGLAKIRGVHTRSVRHGFLDHRRRQWPLINGHAPGKGDNGLSKLPQNQRPGRSPHPRRCLPLARIDALLAQPQQQLVAVAGELDERVAVAEHILRRSEASGRRCVLADGRCHDEPWRELALLVGADPLADAPTVAERLLQRSADLVLVVLESEPTSWGEAITRELVAATKPRPEHGATVFVLTDRRIDFAEQVHFGGAAAPQDLDRYFQGLVEAARPDLRNHRCSGVLA